MSLSINIRACCIAVVFLHAFPIYSQNQSKNESDFTHSLSISPYAVLGAFDGNYEYLAGGRHGLVVEGGYTALGVSSGTYRYGGGYRLHFSPRMESGFVGLFLYTGFLAGELKGEDATYRFESPITNIGINAGKKWVWANGFTIALRGGWGYANSDFTWAPSSPEPEWIGKLMEALIGLDSELSLGYSF